MCCATPGGARHQYSHDNTECRSGGRRGRPVWRNASDARDITPRRRDRDINSTWRHATWRRAKMAGMLT